MVFLLPNFQKFPLSNKKYLSPIKSKPRTWYCENQKIKEFLFGWFFVVVFFPVCFGHCSLKLFVFSLWYHLGTTWKSTHPGQPALSSTVAQESKSETTKPDRIWEVRTRVDRKWSIWTYSRAEEKPKIRSWSADSWPNFLWDNSKNSLMFSHRGSGAENVAQRKAL